MSCCATCCSRSSRFRHIPSKHPFAAVEERLGGGGQSEETSADAGAADQPSETHAGQAAAVQFPRVVADDCGRPQIPGEQEGLPVVQTGLHAEGQDVR